MVLRDLLEVQKIEDPKVLLAAAREHGGVELEGVAMNAFDRVRAEGRAERKAEGRAEGEAEGRVDTILRQSTLKFGAPSEAAIARVRGASVAQLDRFAERILSAASVDEVLA